MTEARWVGRTLLLPVSSPAGQDEGVRLIRPDSIRTAGPFYENRTIIELAGPREYLYAAVPFDDFLRLMEQEPPRG